MFKVSPRSVFAALVLLPMFLGSLFLAYANVQARPQQMDITFLGQDGAGFVGRDCASDPAPDNIHLRVSGLPTDQSPVRFEVDDPFGRGFWILPCNNFNWWLAARSAGPGQVDLYLKPHRYAPDGTPYDVSIQLADGTTFAGRVQGSAVGLQPIPPNLELGAAFFGQDGTGEVGAGCRNDPTPDNIHIRLTGIQRSQQPVEYSVNDVDGYGLWIWPCNNFNWWLAQEERSDTSVDLFLKPHRHAPAGAPYLITVKYADGRAESVWTQGTEVAPGATGSPGAGPGGAPEGKLSVEFRGQDGHAEVGPDCRPGRFPDNIHFAIHDVRKDIAVDQAQVSDPLGGKWVWPCNGLNWSLALSASAPGDLDVFAAPHRDAPAGTRYDVTITYADGTRAGGSVVGTAVTPWRVPSPHPER